MVERRRVSKPMSGQHGFDGSDWIAYLDGDLPPSRRAGMNAHLDECEECRELHHAIREWERTIEDEARFLAAALDRTPEDIDRLAAEAVRRIRRSEPPGIDSRGLGFAQSIFVLRSVLDPLCGEGAARNAVRLATAQSFQERECTRVADWGVFVRNLGAAIGGVYGIPARLLVERIGGLVANKAA